jgi:PPOX class probable F420-dependent enzyme
MTQPSDAGAWEHPGGEQSLAETRRLGHSTYVSLTTYRKDGTGVATPVWVVTDGERLYVWTEATAGKIKRVRNRGHVRVAPCDARGGLQGEPVDGSARVLDAPEDVARVGDMLKAKYGLQFSLFRSAGRLLRRGSGFAALEVTVV